MMLLAFGLTQTSFCQKTITEKLDRLMAAYTSVNKFNGSVLVSRKGNILLEKGYGLKNARSNSVNNTKSIFQIYSITKTFTSTVILRLVEEGKLSLSDKLTRFYPGFPRGDSITIEHLLAHTSGLYDYTRGHTMPDLTETSFVRFIQTKPLDYAPGTSWAYSNSGYWFLGFIIQKMTGMTYEEAVNKYIFKPSGMKESGFDFKTLRHPNKTTGYAIFASTLKKEAVIYDPPGPYAAGAIHSTVGDLYKYHMALQQYSIIKKSSLENAYRPIKNNYGLGWIIGSFEGKQVVSHSGGAAGYRSNFARIPDEDICVILLNNNESASVELITRNIFTILFDKPYEIPYEIKLSDAVLSQYAGAFSLKPSSTMYINREDGRLTAQMSMQHKTIVLARKENYFFAEEANGFLEFIKDEKGNYNELVIHQGGQQIRSKRIYPVWGLTGTATSKDWQDSIPDIPLTEDPVKKGLWTLKNIELKTGVFLFRLNNDWGYHYGDNEKDSIPDFLGADIKIEAGTYDITLDFTNQVEPNYTIIKKTLPPN